MGLVWRHQDTDPDLLLVKVPSGDALYVESSTGVARGRECFNLEIQVLLTDTGVKCLDTFGFEDSL